jgi:glutamine cyclotransferase
MLAPVCGYELIETYPHDSMAFTQGLDYDGGILYEGTGLYGLSGLRKVELETGRILQQYRLPGHIFGEGITVIQGRIVQLSWREHVGLIYDMSLEPVGGFTYPTEGWGLTNNDTMLFMSDGTDTIHLLNKESFEKVGEIRVRDNGAAVGMLNELEMADGLIYANVFPTARIAAISVRSGAVLFWLDLSGIAGPGGEEAVLNGIAYDGERKRLFVTGKLWPNLYEIRAEQACPVSG